MMKETQYFLIMFVMMLIAGFTFKIHSQIPDQARPEVGEKLVKKEAREGFSKYDKEEKEPLVVIDDETFEYTDEELAQMRGGGCAKEKS